MTSVIPPDSGSMADLLALHRSERFLKIRNSAGRVATALARRPPAAAEASIWAIIQAGPPVAYSAALGVENVSGIIWCGFCTHCRCACAARGATLMANVIFQPLSQPTSHFAVAPGLPSIAVQALFKPDCSPVAMVARGSRNTGLLTESSCPPV